MCWEHFGEVFGGADQNDAGKGWLSVQGSELGFRVQGAELRIAGLGSGAWNVNRDDTGEGGYHASVPRTH